MKITEIYNPIKKLFCLSLVVIGMMGCVEEDPLEVNLAPGAFSDLVDLEIGVNGVYSKLNAAASWSDFYIHAWAGDDMTTHPASNKVSFREFDQLNVTDINPRTNDNWNRIYGTIFAANSAIQNFNASSIAGSQDEQNRLIGEVYFIRALCYSHLLRVHERVALLTEPVIDYNIQLSSREEVMLQIERDLQEAESKLPAVQSGFMDAVRPNSGSAKALLARLYLDWAGFPLNDQSKYALAAAKAKEVIDNAGSHGFGLMNKLEDLWSVFNRTVSESVFTIVFSDTDGTALVNRKYGISGMVGGRTPLMDGGETSLNGWDEILAEVRFFEDFPEGARKEATYRTELDWSKHPDPERRTPMFQKVAGKANDELAPNQWQTVRGDFYMRYAEVLLIYAEATGRAGGNDAEAWEALNKVRRRAAGLPWEAAVTAPVNQQDADGNEDATLPQYQDVTSGDLAELTFEERKWELAGEWLRWSDLVRMDRVADALSNRAPRVSTNPDGQLLPEQNPIIGPMTNDNYFVPIPSAQVDQLLGLDD
ncbi:MAG: RagB/SusD family nutrient uptake outer membrane protein [Bacteroidota bacterium]